MKPELVSNLQFSLRESCLWGSDDKTNFEKKNLAIPAKMVTHLATGSHFLNDGNDIGGFEGRKKEKSEKGVQRPSSTVPSNKKRQGKSCANVSVVCVYCLSWDSKWAMNFSKSKLGLSTSVTTAVIKHHMMRIQNSYYQAFTHQKTYGKWNLPELSTALALSFAYCSLACSISRSLRSYSCLTLFSASSLWSERLWTTP